MPNSQQTEDVPGRADPSTPGPEAGSPTGSSDDPTLYEFLTRLSSNPDARAEFDADPRASLDQAGLGDMSAADVLHATSLVLDYAPVEVVENHGRALQDSADKFSTSSQYAAINHLHPAHPHEQEVTELSMLNNAPETKPDFTDGGDTDEQMPAPQQDTNIEVEQTDSHNLVNVHDVVSDNNVANVAAVGNTVGDTAENTVGTLGDTVNNTVGTVGDTAFGAVGEVTNTVDSTVGSVGDVAGGVAGADAQALPVDGATSAVGDTLDTATEPVGGLVEGATAPVEPVVDTATAPLEPVTSALPVDDVAKTAGDLPIVGDVAGGAAENVGGALPLDGLL